MPTRPDTADIPVFILAGGLGTRFREETEFRPKPMVEIGNRPMLWHIMQRYSHFGFRRFVICMGYRHEVIRQYFLNYYAMNGDCTINLRTNAVTVHTTAHELDWDVTLAYTGEETMTGARLAIAVSRYLDDAEHFAVTYGDGLTDVNLLDELTFHVEHEKLGTLLGVNPPTRFGELVFDGDRLEAFVEKPDLKGSWISGGYFFFRRGFVDYLSEDPASVLEREPLTRLTRDGQLAVYRHGGFWACMDTQRDRDTLNELWQTGDVPWMPRSS